MKPDTDIKGTKPDKKKSPAAQQDLFGDLERFEKDSTAKSFSITSEVSEVDFLEFFFRLIKRNATVSKVTSFSFLPDKINFGNVDFIKQIIDSLGLESFSLNCSGIDVHDFVTVALACQNSKTLKSLSFNHFNFKTEFSYNFVTMISKTKNLESLEMDNLTISCPDGEIGVAKKVFFGSIQRSKTLTSVSLDLESVDPKTEVFGDIAEIVRHNKVLRNLTLKNYKPSFDEIEVLFQGPFENNFTLDSINLIGIKDSDVGIAVSYAIQDNKNLTKIVLDNCNIDEQDALNIANALQNNFTITSLEIANNKTVIPKERLDRINSYLKRNVKLLDSTQDDLISQERDLPLPLIDKKDTDKKELLDKKDREPAKPEVSKPDAVEDQAALVRQLLEQNEAMAARIKALEEQLQLSEVQRDSAIMERDALKKEQQQKIQQAQQLEKMQEKFLDPKKVRARGLFKQHLKEQIDSNGAFQSFEELDQFIKLVLSDAVDENDLQNVLFLKPEDDNYQTSKSRLLKDDPKEFMQNLLNSINTVKQEIEAGRLQFGAVVDEDVLTIETLMELMTELQQEKNPQLPDAKGGSKAEARSSSSSSSNPSLKKPSPTPGATSGNPYMAKGQVSKGKK